MWTFSVWAPKAARMDVCIAGKKHAMSRNEETDWWSAEVQEAEVGTDYLFAIDGGNPVPDPRSLWQPYGVHGASRTFDHGAFAWTDHDWQPKPLSAAIIYELHTGTFTPGGTFESLIERLAYLKELGVTHMELMPVNEFSGDWGWGYDGVDLYAPHHAYGGPEALKRLIDACHAKGLAVILDVVYNHLGPTGNYLSMFGPYFTKHYSTPWGEAVNMDGAGSDEVRRFFIDNALMWLRDYHIDGLRLDAVHAIVDTSATPFLEQLATEVRALEAANGRRKVLIAESDLNDPRVVRSQDIGGYGIDAQWSDDFHHALHAALTGEISGYYEDFGGLEPIAKAFRDTFVYDGQFARNRGRRHGRTAAGVSSHRFLAYTQTHDQVGNRAQGERFEHLSNFAKAKIGAALVMISPFIPMVFQGEEFAASTPFQYFTHHDDLELAKAVSEGRRSEFASFGWKPEDVPDPQDPATFQRSKLKWAELTVAPHDEMLEWYQNLIQLRKATPALSSERGEDLSVETDDASMTIRRGPISVYCNFGNVPLRKPLSTTLKLLLTSNSDVRIERDLLELPAETAVVLLDAAR